MRLLLRRSARMIGVRTWQRSASALHRIERDEDQARQRAAEQQCDAPGAMLPADQIRGEQQRHDQQVVFEAFHVRVEQHEFRQAAAIAPAQRDGNARQTGDGADAQQQNERHEMRQQSHREGEPLRALVFQNSGFTTNDGIGRHHQARIVRTPIPSTASAQRVARSSSVRAEMTSRRRWKLTNTAVNSSA